MNELTVVATTLFTLVAISFVVNLYQLFSESRKLKAAGKTPLTTRNVITVTLAAAAEALTVWLFIWIAGILDIEPTIPFVAALFLLIYIVRNGAAYAAAWALWSIFVKKDSRSLRKKIAKDGESAI